MTHYEVLGIPQNATQEQIKAAYRALAKKYHPDVNDAQNANAFFRLIQEAYETLSDPQRRAEYDSPEPEYEEPPQQQQQVVYYYESDWAAQQRHSQEVMEHIFAIIRENNDARHAKELLHSPKSFAAIFVFRLLSAVMYPVAKLFGLIVRIIDKLSGLLWIVAVFFGILFIGFLVNFASEVSKGTDGFSWANYFSYQYGINGVLLLITLSLVASPFIINFIYGLIEKFLETYKEFIGDIPYLWKHRKEAHK